MDIHMLIAVHHELVCAAGLPESTRPWSVQSNLDIVQKLMMKEISEPSTPPQPAPRNDDDDIPF